MAMRTFMNRSDTAVPEPQAEEEGRYSPTPGVRITRTEAGRGGRAGHGP